jgi:hypothetical protein
MNGYQIIVILFVVSRKKLLRYGDHDDPMEFLRQPHILLKGAYATRVEAVALS